MNNKINWKNDIEFLKMELPKKHKNLFFKKSKKYFESELDKIKNDQKKLSDFEVTIKIQQLIANLGDSHTYINWKKYIKEDKILPMRLYWFKDGIYVIRTTEINKNLLGKKIIRINGYPIMKIVDKLSSLFTVDNDALVKSNIPGLITKTQLLVFFGFSNGQKYELEVEDKMGDKFLFSLQPYFLGQEMNIKFNKIPYCWANIKFAFIENFFKKDNIYYLQYNKCRFESETENNKIVNFKEYTDKIFKIIKEKKPEKIIVDMRFNTGGDSWQGTTFIRNLSKFMKINQTGKLFVVIGRKTFSSAIINTMDFIENTKAIVVGEDTGGKPNHYGEVKNFELPSSKINIMYSTKYFKRVDKDINTIKPDIDIEISFKDFIDGVDPVYEWIVKQ